MMQRVFVCLVVLTTFSGFSQKIAEKDFLRAETYYNKGAFFKADLYYSFLSKSKYAKQQSYLIHSAYCAYKLHQDNKAIDKLIQLQKHGMYSKEGYLLLGQLMMKKEGYQEARSIFKEVFAHEGDEPELEVLMMSCDSALTWTQKGGKLNPLKKVNSSFDDITPTMHHNALVFSSSREGNFILAKSDITGQPNLDFWIAEQKGKLWRKPKKYKNALNTHNDDYDLEFSEDGKNVYLTRTELEDSTSLQLVAKLFNYVSDKEKWKKPLVFNYNKKGVSFMHPSISESGNILFFSSDLPEGYGGMDIYFCVKTDGVWSKPINVGPHINTPKDEVYPCYREGQLYFSSNGHVGYGGFDLYKSVQSPSGWADVVNLKAPVNSGANELSINEFDGVFYFSSDRNGGKGGYDIYEYKE